jgi:predicted lysophospholipase L1 biosynthesis ABC-type transport system permease subunit
MLLHLIRQNVARRPARTLITVLTIGLQVFLLILLAGLTHHHASQANGDTLAAPPLALAVYIASFLISFLLLFRSADVRSYEAAILKSLGASREYIVGYFLCEAALLCSAGAAFGTGAAVVLLAAVRSSGQLQQPGLWLLTGPESSVVAIAGGLLGAGIAAWMASRRSPAEILQGD